MDATRAILDWLRARTDAAIVIGEGAALGSTWDAFENYGYRSLPDEYPDVSLMNLNADEAVELTAFDCVKAPCVATCPASQDIPGYMYYTAMGDYQTALDVILETNPFPNMQGMVCDHLCQYKCTRMNYDRSLLIREIKRFVAQQQDRVGPRQPAAPNGLKVAIIGAGPSGLACAYFLALDGFEIDIYETKDKPGGMAADGIPSFRLDDASLKKDIEEKLKTESRKC